MVWAVWFISRYIWEGDTKNPQLLKTDSLRYISEIQHLTTEMYVKASPKGLSHHIYSSTSIYPSYLYPPKGSMLYSMKMIYQYIKQTRTLTQWQSRSMLVLKKSMGSRLEVLTQTYKAIGRSLLEYGVPIWNPIISLSC